MSISHNSFSYILLHFAITLLRLHEILTHSQKFLFVSPSHDLVIQASFPTFHGRKSCEPCLPILFYSVYIYFLQCITFIFLTFYLGIGRVELKTASGHNSHSKYADKCTVYLFVSRKIGNHICHYFIVYSVI